MNLNLNIGAGPSMQMCGASARYTVRIRRKYCSARVRYIVRIRRKY